MSIPLYEQIRNRRDRKFQSQVLAKIDKTKATPFYQTPLCIWLLSAVLVTVGGTFFSSQSNCYIAAEKLIDEHDKILTELNYREKQVAKAVNSTNSLGDALAKIAEAPLSKSDISGRTSAGLLVRLVYLRSRTDTRLKRDLAPIASVFLYDATVYETNPAELEEARNALKEEVLKRRADAMLQFSFFPSCSYWSSIQSMIGLRPPIATAYDPIVLSDR